MAVLAIALSAVAGIAAQAPPKPTPVATLTGKWTMTLEMQMGTATPTLELVQQGEKITGTYVGRYGKFPLNGVLKGRQLQFTFTMSADGTDVVMSFAAEVAEDFQSMKGDADMGGAGEATWYARRAEK